MGGRLRKGARKRARAKRCAVRALRRQTRGSTIRSCPMPQGVGSTRLKGRAAEPEARRKTIRWKASWVVPPFSPLWRECSSRGENGGTILVRRVKPTSCVGEGARGGSYRSAWNRHGGARGRQGTPEDGTISVKAPPAVARDDQARGVSIQNAERRCRAGSSGMVPVGSRVYRGNRVHRSRIGRSGRKRIAALILPGSGRANGSGPGEAPAPERRSRWKNARERAPRSPCQTQTMGI